MFPAWGIRDLTELSQLLWRLPACVSKDPLALPQINLWYPTQLPNLDEFHQATFAWVGHKEALLATWDQRSLQNEAGPGQRCPGVSGNLDWSSGSVATLL